MKLNKNLQRLLNISLENSEIDYSENKLKRHMLKKKHVTALKYISSIKDIVDKPDYIGLTGNNNLRVELVKRYKGNILLALSVKENAEGLYVASMYEISDYKLASRVNSQRLRNVIDLQNKK